MGATYVRWHPFVLPEEWPMESSTMAYQSPKEALLKIERALIVQALHETDADISKTARDLGISRTVLYSKMKEHRLEL